MCDVQRNPNDDGNPGFLDGFMEFPAKRPMQEQSGKIDQTGKSEESPFFVKTSNSIITPISTITTIKPDWIDKLLKWFSIVTVLLLFFTAVFTYLTLEQTRKQTSASQDAAFAGASSAYTASKSLEEQRRNFQIDQRPYLVAETPVFFEGNVPKPSFSTIVAKFALRNIGKTPAKSYTVAQKLFRFDFSHPASQKAATEAVIMFVGGKLSDLAKIRDNAEVPSDKKGIDLAPSHENIYNSRDISDPTPWVTITSKTDFDRLKTSDIVLLYLGHVEYGDAYPNNSYSTEFCYIYWGDGSDSGWHICPWHNQIR